MTNGVLIVLCNKIHKPFFNDKYFSNTFYLRLWNYKTNFNPPLKRINVPHSSFDQMNTYFNIKYNNVELLSNCLMMPLKQCGEPQKVTKNYSTSTTRTKQRHSVEDLFYNSKNQRALFKKQCEEVEDMIRLQNFKSTTIYRESFHWQEILKSEIQITRLNKTVGHGNLHADITLNLLIRNSFCNFLIIIPWIPQIYIYNYYRKVSGSAKYEDYRIISLISHYCWPFFVDRDKKW